MLFEGRAQGGREKRKRQPGRQAAVDIARQDPAKTQPRPSHGQGQASQLRLRFAQARTAELICRSSALMEQAVQFLGGCRGLLPKPGPGPITGAAGARHACNPGRRRGAAEGKGRAREE